MAPLSENRSDSHEGDSFRRGETDRSTFSDASRFSTPSARLIPAADSEWVPGRRDHCNLALACDDSRFPELRLSNLDPFIRTGKRRKSTNRPSRH